MPDIEDRFAKIAADLRTLKWMAALTIALEAAIIIRVFAE
jgi:hypothetical protein